MNNNFQNISEDIQEQSLQDVLGTKYLSYALSTIMHRALPDVRDGLKPVHRRLLYAMRMLKLSPQLPFKKSARVVGDVIGKYHPHGDQAVYEALVRLAQDFSVRYPLIDGQGNFGNIDGDNPAAMRYTESRLTMVAEALLEGIDEETVAFRDNYDGSEIEPEVLPAAFPNLLANGATGIAVGMATNIPPHNLDEIASGLLVLLENPETTITELVQVLPAPDFPTGGILIESKDSLLSSYETGRGSFRLRARWHKEDHGRGQYIIVVTEIPYQVQKSRLIEKIASLLEEKKLPLVDDIRDESDDAIRLVIVPKNRTVEADVLMEMLFRITDLEVKISLNMNVLDEKHVPSVMSLKQVLQAFLNHRRQVLVNRSQFRLRKIEERLHLLEGFLKVYINLDEVIRIIREEDHPKALLMEKFGLSETQVEAILNLRLRALAKIQQIEIEAEHQKLSDEKEKLETLLSSDKKQWKRIQVEIEQMKAKFGNATGFGKRRTTILNSAPDVALPTAEDAVENEPITVVCSEKGWIRTLKGHVDLSNASIKYKEGDSERFVFHAGSADKLIVFTTGGKSFTLAGDKLPSGRSLGEPVRLMMDIPDDQEILSIISCSFAEKMIVASNKGRGFVVPVSELVASTRTGKQVLNLDEGETAKIFIPVRESHLAIIGENRRLLVFPVAEIAEMSKGKGVMLQKYKDGGVACAWTLDPEKGLTWTGQKVAVKDLSAWTSSRGSQGATLPKGFPWPPKI